MSALLVAANLLVIALGFLIAAQSFRGYRRHQNATMLYISAGFVCISLGGVMDCSLLNTYLPSLLHTGLFRTGFVLAGMGLISYSLYR
ncbi:hypothetical protein KTS45_03795 [Halomicroarcula limicola]|uniref:Uncharacterized protein n=1 Tax=Haloarcula limicola TaxID=1429915 RepID=A0A8J7Y344_9EURY|nr:hypothetical protein [Halomicroarcula limicola]MBV0923312.1 hypothetical protein [Halomicroarcula limicola]